MTASTLAGDLFDANAAGFLQKVALGATIIPFSQNIPTTSSDEIADRVQICPLVARGGRNRLIAVMFECAALDSDGALRAKLVVNMNSADTDLETAANYGAARTFTCIFPNLTLDDTDNDMVATLDWVVTTAGTSADAGVLKGLLIYE